MINQVAIAGNLTRDAQKRTAKSGVTMLTFTVAVNDRRKNQATGEWEDVPNFIDCVMFGNRADALEKYLTKGLKVAAQGKLRYSTWEQDGAKRSKIDVVVDELEFMSARQAKPVQDAYVPF